MRKILILLIWFFINFEFAKGHSQSNALILYKSDGEKITIMFDDMPNISFKCNDIIIHTRLMDVVYPYTDIIGFTHKYVETTNIGKIKSNENICIKYKNDNVIITGLEAKSSAMVISLDGNVLVSTTADLHGIAKIRLATIPTNVYIIKTSCNYSAVVRIDSFWLASL